MSARAWAVTVAAALLMGLVGGGRSAFGLFVSPLNSASGLGLASISFALALGQLGVGLLQPLVGSLADRAGPARVVLCGALLLAAATALPAWWPSAGLVAVTVVLAALAGSAVGSNGLLLGEVNRVVPAARAGLAVGLVGAGASIGQLVLGPLTQALIDAHGWRSALLASGGIALVALPLSLLLRRPRARAGESPPPAPPVADALRDARFWRVAASFGVCGFHIAFLAVHMPGVIERCGLDPSLAGNWIALAGAANIAGSLLVGAALRRVDAGRLLVALYLARGGAVVALLALPVSVPAMLGFALAMGFTHMATLPPTAQLVARQHGVQRLGTLFGVVMLVHQVGSFAGIWLGGWAAAATGSDTLLWTVDVALALLAATLVWPRRRAPSHAPAAAALAAPAQVRP